MAKSVNEMIIVKCYAPNEIVDKIRQSLEQKMKNEPDSLTKPGTSSGESDQVASTQYARAR